MVPLENVPPGGGPRKDSRATGRRRTSLFVGDPFRKFSLKGMRTESQHIELQKKHSVAREQNEKQQAEFLQQAKASIVDPIGVLAVHLKKMNLLTLEAARLYQRSDACTYIRVHTTSETKCSCVYDHVQTPTNLIFDDLKHFLIKVSPKCSDPVNFLRLELVVFNPDNPTRHRILSAREIHIYDIIKQLYVVETYEMRRGKKAIAEVDVEFCFSYGQYGYGMSNQLENRQKQPKEQIMHSMFCRVEPPVNRRDAAHDVMTAIPVGHPAFIRFTQKVDLNPLEFAEDMKHYDWQTIEEPTMVLAKLNRRLHYLQSKFAKLNNRRTRLDFLKQLVTNNIGARAPEFKEEFEVPRNYRLRRRAHARRFRGDDGIARPGTDRLEKSDIDLMAKVLSAAPGIVIRKRDEGPTVKIEEPTEATVKEETPGPGTLLGIRRVFRRVSAAVGPLLAWPSRRDHVPTTHQSQTQASGGEESATEIEASPRHVRKDSASPFVVTTEQGNVPRRRRASSVVAPSTVSGRARALSVIPFLQEEDGEEGEDGDENTRELKQQLAALYTKVEQVEALRKEGVNQTPSSLKKISELAHDETDSQKIGESVKSTLSSEDAGTSFGKGSDDAEYEDSEDVAPLTVVEVARVRRLSTQVGGVLGETLRRMTLATISDDETDEDGNRRALLSPPKRRSSLFSPDGKNRQGSLLASAGLKLKRILSMDEQDMPQFAVPKITISPATPEYSSDESEYDFGYDEDEDYLH